MQTRTSTVKGGLAPIEGAMKEPGGTPGIRYNLTTNGCAVFLITGKMQAMFYAVLVE